MSYRKNRIALCAVLLGALASSDAQAQWTQEFLSQARTAPCAVSVGGKLIVAGGDLGFPMPTGVVDIYDEATDTWTQEALPTPRASVAAAAVGDYALFAGGYDGNAETSAVVEILHVPTMSWTSTTLSEARRWMGATTVGNKVIFAGGQNGHLFSPGLSDAVDIYDADLGLPDDSAAWSTTTLVEARNQPAATTVGHLALFAGGNAATGLSDTVDIYNDSTGQWSTALLSQPRVVGLQSATTVGTRAYFAGGTPASSVIDIYDAQTGAWTTDALSTPRSSCATIAVGQTILFAGGYPAAGVPTDLVEVFDAGTNTWLPPTSLSEARGGIVRAAVNGKGFFAGGNVGGGVHTALVDVYEPVVSGPWTGLGHALPGVNGDPILLGSGPLTTGSAGSLTLSNAADGGALAVLFVSVAGTPTPFKGGTLLPVPLLAQYAFVTVGTPGSVTLPWASWPNGLSGVSLYFQWGVQDGGAILGAALSNALRADVP
jgi:hypothetical protein